MKKRSAIAVIIALILVFMSVSFFGCADATKYKLTVLGGDLLYEPLEESYKAGEEVVVKVKITPNQNTVAFLDGVPLARAKSTQNNFYTFTFNMPYTPATFCIETVKGFGESLLTGFYLTFCDKEDNPIESLNKKFDSSEAVARYYYIYFDEEIDGEVITSNDGADVFGNGKVAATMDTAWGLKQLELETTLYFTYEMLDAVAMTEWVYFDPQTREFTLLSGAGFTLDDMGSWSTRNEQRLSETRYSASGEEYEATFDAEVKISFEYIDYLTGVKVLEYDENKQLIKSSDFTGNNRSETFTVGENCEFAVIEEEYTVMNGERKGEKKYERTLIEETALNNGKTLMYPRGDGLISPVYLNIRWGE